MKIACQVMLLLILVGSLIGCLCGERRTLAYRITVLLSGALLAAISVQAGAFSELLGD